MSVGGHASRYGDNDFLMANILWRISRLLWRISHLLWQISDCLWRISKSLWRKSHRAMAENILVWRKFLKTRTNHIYVFFWPSSHLSLSSLEKIPASSARRALRGTPDAKGRACSLR